MTPRRLLLLAAAGWCAAIVVTPLLVSLGGIGSRAAAISYDCFSRVCHQFDTRSFHIAGHKFAVCIRCTAIYFSFLVGIFLSPKLQKTRLSAVPPSYILLASLAPMGLDVGLAALGIHDSNALTRTSTGLLFGAALGIVLFPVLEEVTAALIQRGREAFHRANHPGKSGLDFAEARAAHSYQRDLNDHNPHHR